MSEFYCNESFQYYPSKRDFKDLRSTIIANCIFNSFLTHTAIMLNIVTIYAIHTAATIAKPSFITEPCYLLLEDEKCSTRYHRHTLQDVTEQKSATPPNFQSVFKGRS